MMKKMKQENRYHSNKSDGRVVYGVVVVGLVQHPCVWLPVKPPPKTEKKTKHTPIHTHLPHCLFVLAARYYLARPWRALFFWRASFAFSLVCPTCAIPILARPPPLIALLTPFLARRLAPFGIACCKSDLASTPGKKRLIVATLTTSASATLL